MPIVRQDGAPIVRCVTLHPDQQSLRPLHGTRMLVSSDAFEPNVLVRAYYCDVCGYVETYLAAQAPVI